MNLDFLPTAAEVEAKREPKDLAKPERGAARRDRQKDKAERDAHERAEKQAVRVRDKKCRWPGCTNTKDPIEVAHLHHKSMGGNPANDRSERHLMILFCQRHHRGSVNSMDSGDLWVEPKTDRGTQGPVTFYQRNEHGQMVIYAEERSVGVSVTRDGR